MKLLLVFVSALAVVAHAKVVSSDDPEQVYVVDIPEEVGAYALDVDTVKESGSVEPQSVLVEQRNDPSVRVFGAEEQRVESPQAEHRAASEFELPASIYIPIFTKSCTNSACLYICNLLGFKNGVCVSLSTCQCSN